MARRRDSSIFSSGKPHSRIPTIFFSYNKRKSEYLNTVLEQSLLLTRWHQKECAHMNETCTAIENITNDALSRIVKIQTRNSYSLKIKKTLHTWGIVNSTYLMFTRRKGRREDSKTYMGKAVVQCHFRARRRRSACIGWRSSTPSNPVASRVGNLSGCLWIKLCDEKVRKRYRRV